MQSVVTAKMEIDINDTAKHPYIAILQTRVVAARGQFYWDRLERRIGWSIKQHDFKWLYSAFKLMNNLAANAIIEDVIHRFELIDRKRRNLIAGLRFVLIFGGPFMLLNVAGIGLVPRIVTVSCLTEFVITINLTALAAVLFVTIYSIIGSISILRIVK